MTQSFLDALNKAKGNQMNTLDELRVVLDDTAQDMAQVVPDPGEWDKFIIYFLEELEDKAVDRAGFFKMLLEVQDWLAAVGCQTIYISPSSPWENAYIESFIGKFRKECVDRYLFHTLEETRNTIEDWRREYNHYRPYSALGYLPPSAFAAQHSQTPLPNQEDHIRV